MGNVPSLLMIGTAFANAMLELMKKQ